MVYFTFELILGILREKEKQEYDSSRKYIRLICNAIRKAEFHEKSMCGDN